MFCKNCGTSIPDGATSCPGCHAVVDGAPAAPAAPEEKKSILSAPTKGGKNFTALASAFLLIPAIFTIMIDYIVDYAVDWPPTGYVVGALLVCWICAVLPALKITPAPVTAIICFASVALYIMYIVKQISGSMEWFTLFALPMLMIFAVFVGVDSALTQNESLHKFMAGIVAAEGAVYCFVWGLLWTNYHGQGLIQPRLSIIAACGCLMLSVILLAMGYVKGNNKSE